MVNINQFIKPDWRKLLIFLLFVSLITIIFQSSIMGGWSIKETTYFILPFPSITHREISCDNIPTPYASECKPESSFKINYLNLALNIAFWYLLSCLIIWIFDKFRKSK